MIKATLTLLHSDKWERMKELSQLYNMSEIPSVQIWVTDKVNANGYYEVTAKGTVMQLANFLNEMGFRQVRLICKDVVNIEK